MGYGHDQNMIALNMIDDVVREIAQPSDPKTFGNPWTRFRIRFEAFHHDPKILKKSIAESGRFLFVKAGGIEQLLFSRRQELGCPH